MKNYYSILNVSMDASQEEIRTAFRNLVKQYHPDVNHSDEAYKTMQEITEAYSVLSNEEKRRKYDLSLLRAMQEDLKDRKRYVREILYQDTGLDNVAEICSEFVRGLKVRLDECGNKLCDIVADVTDKMEKNATKSEHTEIIKKIKEKINNLRIK